jgi:heme oxygenase (mycobilin-producing)
MNGSLNPLTILEKTMLRRLVLSSLAVLTILVSSAFAQDNKVVLINVFEVPATQEAEVMQTWIKSKEFLEKQPGYISTRLHKNIDPNGKFRFINVAEWASPQQFQGATKAMNESAVPKMPDGVRFSPGLFKVVAQ